VNKETLDEAISFVAGYVGGTTDWIVIKKELLKTLSPEDRRYFSTRDPVTKKQGLNNFEKIVMEKWYQTTGNRPIFMGRNE
jgi:hypothetical protein